MKSFAEQILESNKRFNVVSSKDMENYVNKLNKNLPEDVKKTIKLLIHYNVNDESILNRILHGSSVDLRIISKETGISQDNIEKLRQKSNRLCLRYS